MLQNGIVKVKLVTDIEYAQMRMDSPSSFLSLIGDAQDSFPIEKGAFNFRPELLLRNYFGKGTYMDHADYIRYKNRVIADIGMSTDLGVYNSRKYTAEGMFGVNASEYLRKQVIDKSLNTILSYVHGVIKGNINISGMNENHDIIFPFTDLGNASAKWYDSGTNTGNDNADVLDQMEAVNISIEQIADRQNRELRNQGHTIMSPKILRALTKNSQIRDLWTPLALTQAAIGRNVATNITMESVQQEATINSYFGKIVEVNNQYKDESGNYQNWLDPDMVYFVPGTQVEPIATIYIAPISQSKYPSFARSSSGTGFSVHSFNNIGGAANRPLQEPGRMEFALAGQMGVKLEVNNLIHAMRVAF